MTKKEKAEMDEFGLERYREGYGDAIGAVYANLTDQASKMEDFDSHGAALLRYLAQVIAKYEPGE